MASPRETGPFAVMWYCPHCQRPLENDGRYERADTVTVDSQLLGRVVHDDCGQRVAYSGRSIARA